MALLQMMFLVKLLRAFSNVSSLGFLMRTSEIKAARHMTGVSFVHVLNVEGEDDQFRIRMKLESVTDSSARGSPSSGRRKRRLPWTGPPNFGRAGRGGCAWNNLKLKNSMRSYRNALRSR